MNHEEQVFSIILLIMTVRSKGVVMIEKESNNNSSENIILSH